ncbi:MAG: hypothetical protein MPJ52_00530 [Alphaproteobacteria bacterium]|nr:hypothetical protein [Alphaproteobacteria bacterium]
MDLLVVCRWFREDLSLWMEQEQMRESFFEKHRAFFSGMERLSFGLSGASILPPSWYGATTRSQERAQEVASRPDCWFLPEDVEDYIEDWEMAMQDFADAYQQVVRPHSARE